MRFLFTALIVTVLTAGPGAAYFDLFIPKDIMQQIVQTFKDSKVFYVYNGTVNRYALKFKIQVPAHIDRLYFSWINRSKQKLMYTIGFTVGNQLAMAQPELNVSSRGFVPHSVSGFEVRLLCSGAIQSEVSIGLHINVTAVQDPAARSVSLSIMRSKVCAVKAATAAAAAAAAADVLVDSSADQRRLEKEGSVDKEKRADGVDGEEVGGLSTRAFALLLSGSCLSVALIGGLAAVYFCRARRRRRQLRRRQASMLATASAAPGCSRYQQPQPQQLPGPLGNYSRVETCSQTSGYTSCSLPSHHRNGGSSSPAGDHRMAAAPAELLGQASGRDLLRELWIPWDRITLKCIMMEGQFGRIYRGSLRTKRDLEEEVLIKTVSDAEQPEKVGCFVHQAAGMCDLQHPNLSCVIAASRIPGDPRPHLLYAYPTEGNLKLYLMRCRGAQATSVYCVLSTQQLIGMASQLARGLQHMHRKKFIHGDVACRNCVLSSDYTVKLTDSALSRDLFPEDYETVGEAAVSLPLRWMPPEAPAEAPAPAADVWSLGVALWELITRCQQPFADVPPALLRRRLAEGCRLLKPANCPDQLYSIMCSCWHPDPDQRPRLSQIVAEIGDFSAALRSYV